MRRTYIPKLLRMAQEVELLMTQPPPLWYTQEPLTTTGSWVSTTRRCAMHVDPAAFLPHIHGLRLDHVAVTADLITLTLTCVRASAPCPLCQRPSTKVHSSYTRTVADLPWSDRRVSLCVQTRRFVCAVATCARKIFCERLPDLVAVSARRTHNLRARLH